MAIGYGFRWHRSRIKVSLATHIEQSWSDRSIYMSITNHGNTPITVDSWTVHVPLEDLLPSVAERLQEVAERDDKPKPARLQRLRSIHRFASRIPRLPGRGRRIAMANELSEAFALSMLNDPHLRHELLDLGTTQPIKGGESAVRRFPRTSTVPQTQPIVSDTQQLTIIPSCHVVGRRRRIWGWPSSLLGGGPIPMAFQITPPRIDAEN